MTSMTNPSQVNGMRILVLDGYTLNPGDNPWDPVAALGDLEIHDHTPPEQIVERARAAQIILTNKAPLSDETIAQLDALRLICVTATGYNVVDGAAARRRGIPVCNVPVYGTDSVAQFVLALILNHCHQIARHDAAVHAGEWSRSPHFCFWLTPQLELAGKTIGIVGFGRIGRRVGELAHAFGLRVLACSPSPGPEVAYPVRRVALAELFSLADFVTLHCPQTPATTGMVDRALLARMKPGAYLVNTARGGLINEADLAAALAAGRLAGAALDVVSTEPIAPDNPLLRAPNLVITPHMAWASLEARRRLMRTTAENIAAFLRGAPINVVN